VDQIGGVLVAGYLYLLGATAGLAILLLVRSSAVELTRRRKQWLHHSAPLGPVSGLLYLGAVASLGLAMLGSTAGGGSPMIYAWLLFVWWLVYVVAFLGAAARPPLSVEPLPAVAHGRARLKLIRRVESREVEKVA
jgi:hypothetical protein